MAKATTAVYSISDGRARGMDCESMERAEGRGVIDCKRRGGAKARHTVLHTAIHPIGCRMLRLGCETWERHWACAACEDLQSRAKPLDGTSRAGRGSAGHAGAPTLFSRAWWLPCMEGFVRRSFSRICTNWVVGTRWEDMAGPGTAVTHDPYPYR